jgi:N-acetylmuramoyl-L-alanine amidase
MKARGKMVKMDDSFLHDSVRKNSPAIPEPPFRNFGFRVSDFLRISGFGFRIFLLTALLLSPAPLNASASFVSREGDEIVVAGRFVHTGTPVVLWLDPGGYDAYRVERRFAPSDSADWDSTLAELPEFGPPNRYDMRHGGDLTEEDTQRVRGGSWDLPTLQKVVDLLVIHYDAAGASRQCFRELQDVRDLSVHFLLDLDGTIYQTLDLKERARHAGNFNSRSIGIELANIGAASTHSTNSLAEWYARDTNGQTRITMPERFGGGGLRNPAYSARPARPEPVTGSIHGKEFVQYDYTPEQYAALIKLTATLCEIFPRLQPDCPRDDAGKVIAAKLPDNVLTNFHGVLGHFHLQTNKIDPGPAFQWDELIKGVKQRSEKAGAQAEDGRQRTETANRR